MNTRLVLPAIVLTMIFVGVNPLAAHHSFSGEFDVTRPTTFKGWSLR